MNARRGAFHYGGEPAAGLTDTATGRSTRDGGFALPIVIFALVLLGVIGVAALQTSRDELLSAVAVSNSSQAFYAAEAGIHSAVSNWDQGAMDTLVAGPGDSLVGSWTTIENRCSYRLVYRRIDGGDAPTAFYSVESTGQSPGLNGGRRRIGIIMKGGFVTGAIGAVAFDGGLEISGNPTIVGACGQVHSNDSIDMGGNPTIAGDVSTSGTATGTGSPVDTLGNPITPIEGAPPIPIPDLDPNDYCGEADFIFDSAGQGLKVSTSQTFDFSGGSPKWGWKWDPGNNIYLTDSDSIEEGVYCIDGNIKIANAIGTAGNPADVTFLATGSFEISGNPYLTAAHSDGILVIADGDVKLNGNPTGGADNFQGVVYGGSQCDVSGNPSIFGQLICKDNPNPPGSQDLADTNIISGNMTLTYMCGGPFTEGGVSTMVPIAGRMWNHAW